MRQPEDQITYMLDATANVTVTSNYGLGRDAAMPADEFPLAEISETLDEDTCQLCAMLDGQIMRRDSPEYDEFRWPSHINCRRIMIYIGKDEIDIDGEPMQPTFVRPDDDIIAKHGHFHVDPNKYAELRMPSRPEGRDFIFVRGSEGVPSQILWTPGLSREAMLQTMHEMLDLGRSPIDLIDQWVHIRGSGFVQVGDLPRDVDFDTYLSLHSQLEDLVGKYPAGIDNGPFMVSMRSPGKGYVAGWVETERTLYLDPQLFRDQQALWACSERIGKIIKDGGYPRWISTPDALLTHEYGHACFWSPSVDRKAVVDWWESFGMRRDTMLSISKSDFDNEREAFANAFAAIVGGVENVPSHVMDLAVMLAQWGVI